MQAPQMWKVSKGQGVTVAVVDTGVRDSLPELRGKVLPGKDFTEAPTGAHRDTSGHGTNMAALVAGSGEGGGIQGLAPEASILPIKIPVDKGVGFGDSNISRAIRYAVDGGAKVINISVASAGTPSSFPATQRAVDYALRKGVLIFAGVGNDGEKGNPIEFPAALPGVVGVASVDRSVQVSKFSNHGDQVALAAPGQDIPEYCTKTQGNCIAWGTSQATALASASAALIWAKHPKWTNYQVLRVMMQTAGRPDWGDVPSDYVGYGAVRPRLALLEGKGDPGPADVNPLLAREGANHPAPSASASTGESAQPTSSPQPKSPAPAPSHAAAKDDSDGDGKAVWIGVGVAAVVSIGAVGLMLARRRRH
ncbi:type VII secretion-associated serine protease mycosin [Streptomyces palmae]